VKRHGVRHTLGGCHARTRRRHEQVRHHRGVQAYNGRMQRVVGPFALIVCACLFAGCGGGGGSATYSKSALAACLRQHGAQIARPNSSMPSSFKANVTKFVGSSDWVVAEFPGGGPDVFGFAASASGARKLEARDKRHAKSAFVESQGNLVLVAPLGPIKEAERKVISSCEAGAKRT
jgi:hypothetical protein